MFPDTTYISLGISPSADAIVLQPVIPDGTGLTFFASTISIAELESFGRAGAISVLGGFTLTAMRSYYPIINIYADALIPPVIGKRLAVQPPDHSGSKREHHLRIRAVVHEEKGVVIRRFSDDDEAGGDPGPLLLDTLMELGPAGASDYVGTMLLEELAALHPEVFAEFPRLRAH